MDAILLLVGFAIGWAVGSKITEAIHVMSFKKIMEDLDISDQQLKKLAKANGIDLPENDSETNELEVCEIRIEQHQGQLYAYRKSDDHFLGQGTDRDTLIERLKSQFQKDIKLVITEEDGANLIKQIG
jgi:hypothetical protein